MKMRHIVLLFILVLTGVFSAYSDDKTITFVYENYPPYEFEDRGTPSGIHVGAIQKTCAKIGYKAIFINASWRKAISMVKKGEVDAIFSLNRNKEREGYLYFVERPLSNTFVKLFSIKKASEISNFKELSRKKKLGVVESYSYGENFDKLKGITKLLAPTNEALTRQFFHHWVDSIVINEKVFEYYEKKLNIKKKSFYRHPILIQEGFLYVGFSKKAKDSYRKYRRFSAEYMKNVETLEFNQ